MQCGRRAFATGPDLLCEGQPSQRQGQLASRRQLGGFRRQELAAGSLVQDHGPNPEGRDRPLFHVPDRLGVQEHAQARGIGPLDQNRLADFGVHAEPLPRRRAVVGIGQVSGAFGRRALQVIDGDSGPFEASAMQTVDNRDAHVLGPDLAEEIAERLPHQLGRPTERAHGGAPRLDQDEVRLVHPDDEVILTGRPPEGTKDEILDQVLMPGPPHADGVTNGRDGDDMDLALFGGLRGTGVAQHLQHGGGQAGG